MSPKAKRKRKPAKSARPKPKSISSPRASNLETLDKKSTSPAFVAGPPAENDEKTSAVIFRVTKAPPPASEVGGRGGFSDSRVADKPDSLPQGYPEILYAETRSIIDEAFSLEKLCMTEQTTARCRHIFSRLMPSLLAVESEKLPASLLLRAMDNLLYSILPDFGFTRFKNEVRASNEWRSMGTKLAALERSRRTGQIIAGASAQPETKTKLPSIEELKRRPSITQSVAAQYFECDKRTISTYLKNGKLNKTSRGGRVKCDEKLLKELEELGLISPV